VKLCFNSAEAIRREEASSETADDERLGSLKRGNNVSMGYREEIIEKLVRRRTL